MTKKLLFFLLTCLILNSAACQSQEYKIPDNLNDGWETASITKYGIGKKLLDKLLADLDGEKFPNTHSVLIIKDNKLVYEKYLHGYSNKRKHYTASVSKSAGAILTGIAIQEGLIPDLAEGMLDKPLYELFPKHKTQIIEDSAKSTILFRHLLSMSGGLEWDETTHPYNDSRNDWVTASNSEDPIAYLFNKKVVTEPGKVFNYNGGYSIMLSEQIQRLSGKTALKYAEEKLFKSLKITDYEWESLSCGLTDTDGGLHLLPRDMAKLGQLYLNKGSWNGQQIVSEKWIEESTKEQFISQGMPNYGFQWWCGNFHYKGKSAYTYFASGHGGQKIFVFPEFEAVIVITHQVFNNNYGELNNIKMLSNYILPALDTSLEKKENYELSLSELKKYAGNYSNSNDKFEIKLENNKLTVSDETRPTLTLIPIAENEFNASMPEGIDVQFSFTQNADGSVKGLGIYFSFREMEYSKK